MARRIRKTAWSRSFQSVLKTMTRTTMRVGTRAIKESLQTTPLAGKRMPAKKAIVQSANWMTGIAIGAAGTRRYRLYKPSGVYLLHQDKIVYQSMQSSPVSWFWRWTDSFIGYTPSAWLAILGRVKLPTPGIRTHFLQTALCLPT